VYAESIATINNGALALSSTLVATNAIPMAEAITGCVVMVVVVVTVGTPTVIGAVNGRPEAGSCSVHWEGNLRNSESSSRRAGIPDGVSDTGTCMLPGKKSADVTTRLESR